MAAGEYISVASQRDTEQADIDKERVALNSGPAVREMELNELIQIYVDRGLSQNLARQVAVALTEKDAVRAHSRVILGMSPQPCLATPVLLSKYAQLTSSGKDNR